MSTLTALYIRIRNNRFAQDSFWALLGNVAAKGMSLLGSILVARFLGKEVFGEFGTIKSTLMNLAIFSTFGLGYTATKYIAENKESRPEILRVLVKLALQITTVVSGLMAVLLIVFADHIAQNVLKAAHLETPLRIVAIWLVFNALTTTQIGILAGFGAFKPMAKINACVGIIAFATSAILTYLFLLEGALVALLITQAANWVLNYKEINNYSRSSNQSLSSELRKELIVYSIPVALQEGLYALTSWVTIILLMNTGGYGEVGLYTATLQWSAVLLFVPGILRNVILSHLSERSNFLKDHQKYLMKTLFINGLVTSISAIIIWFMMPYILAAYGPSYQGLDIILIIVCATAILISLSNVYAQAYLSIGKNWQMFWLRFTRDFLTIIFFLLLNTIISSKAMSLALSLLIINFLFLLFVPTVYNTLLKNQI